MEEYLAKNYGGGDSKRKGRKKASKQHSTSLIIIDPDEEDSVTMRKSESETIQHNTTKPKWKTIDYEEGGSDDDPRLSSEELEDDVPRKRSRAQDSPQRSNSPDISGRHAKTIHRNAFGKIITESELAAESEKKKRVAMPQKSMAVQLNAVQSAKESRAKVQAAASRGFAVYKDDDVLNDEQRGKSRDGDPMAARKGNLNYQKYKGYCPPNRYGILPGYRWDGVDRSNGYEVKLYHRKSEKEIISEKANKWSTEDM